MNKAVTILRGIIFTLFSFIFNFIPCMLSVFAIIWFLMLDSKVFPRIYGFVVIAAILLILLILQLVFNFKTHKVCQIILTVTFAIDLAGYITLTVYVYNKQNIILDDFIGSKLNSTDFKMFTVYIESKFDCCGYNLTEEDQLQRCFDANKTSCAVKLHDFYDDHKQAFRLTSLVSTLVLAVILIVCVLCVVLEFVCNKQKVSNQQFANEYSYSNESEMEDESNDLENPNESENNNESNSEKPAAPQATKNSSSPYNFSDDDLSESEANKKLENEIFFGERKVNSLEADPYEN
ncbi:hypothetical protein M9Y10_035566 [Tritrichomonas musculus]|uniref:Tetraspanin family protein n=1 Tax=Tritrichomonas musculus TaxID=1915356 RepID=A0ABR2GW43_9EUKA